MKRLILGTAAALVLSTATAFATERTVVLTVQNMTCAACPITVSKALSGVEGVKSVDVSLGDQSATVVYDDAVAHIDAIAEASTFAGYPAQPRATQ